MAAITTYDTFTTVEDPITDWTSSAGVDVFAAAGGVAVPGDRSEDEAMSYAGGDKPSTADQRAKVTVNFTTLGAFGLYARLTTASDLTSDHIRVVFTPGMSTAPAFNEPDTFQIIQRISNVETPITPSNTASGVHSLYPAWDATAKTFSMRADRIASGDTFELQVIDKQVIVKWNNVPIAHETCTVDQTGSIGIINYADPGADNTYDDFKGGDLVGRYVSKTGDDMDSGLLAAPWATIAKGATSQVAGEVCFVMAGTYNENLTWTSSYAGRPRIPSGHEDAVEMYALAGDAVENVHWSPFAVGNGADQYCQFMHWCNIDFRISVGGNAAISIPNWATGFTNGASYGFYFIGCGVYDAEDTGLSIGDNTGSADEGDNWIRDCHVKGNGRNNGAAAGLKHNMYLHNQGNRVEYNTVDGDTHTLGPCYGIGIQYYYSTDGVPTRNSNGRVNYNVFKNHDNHTNGRGILIASGTDMQVIGNYVHNNYKGIDIYKATVDLHVENNVVYSNTQEGIIVTGQFGAVHSGVNILSNTVVSNGGIGIHIETSSGGGSTVDSVVKNNIGYGNNGTYFATTDNYTDNGGVTTASNNSFDNTDPKFVDTTTYSLLATSTMIGAGADLSGVMIYEIDKIGYARPQAGWDIGAYVYPTPPNNNPIMSMNAIYEGFAGATINLGTIQVVDADGDARSVYLNVTGTLTLGIDPTGVTVRGGI